MFKAFSVVGDDSVELPGVGYPLELVCAAWFERDTRSGHQTLDHSGRDGFPRSCHVEHSGSEVDGDAADVVAAALHFRRCEWLP